MKVVKCQNRIENDKNKELPPAAVNNYSFLVAVELLSILAFCLFI